MSMVIGENITQLVEAFRAIPSEQIRAYRVQALSVHGAYGRQYSTYPGLSAWTNSELEYRSYLDLGQNPESEGALKRLEYYRAGLRNILTGKANIEVSENDKENAEFGMKGIEDAQEMLDTNDPILDHTDRAMVNDRLKLSLGSIDQLAALIYTSSQSNQDNST